MAGTVLRSPYTHPDGTNETLGPFQNGCIGGSYTIYTPTIAGNYTLQSFFPQQTNPAAINSNGLVIPTGATMLASSSEAVTLIVLQTEPIPTYQTQPLPTEYWTRPINDQFQSWQVIGGNWLPASNNAGTYNRIAWGNDLLAAPHILWSRPITAGGLIGGAQSFILGKHYQTIELPSEMHTKANS